MRQFKKSKLFIVVFLLLFTAFLLFSIRRSNAIVSTSSNVIAKIDTVISSPFRWLEDLKIDLENMVNASEENIQLKETLYSLKNDLGKATSLELENAQLRNLLNMQNNNQASVQLSADVISRTPVAWNQELTVEIGTNKNVSENMLAIANGGLIGNVTTVNSSSAVIQLLTNEKSTSNISVKLISGSSIIYGIITGFDSEKNIFIVSQLNSQEDIAPGSSVLTSGLGTYKVADISVGSVVEVINSEDSLTRVIYVKPSAVFDDIQVLTLVGN